MKSIAVISQKGGTGKTTITASLGINLVERGYEVGFIDADITSASIHLLFNVKEEQDYINGNIIPAEVHRNGCSFQLSSVAFPIGDIGIQWQGGYAKGVVKHLYQLTKFDTIDYLLIDLPPTFREGTAEILKQVGYALLVIAPGVLTNTDVQRTLDTLRIYETPIIGAVENYSYIKCPKCGEEYDMFAESTNPEKLNVLDRIPFIPKTETVDIDVSAILEAMEDPLILKQEEGFKTKALKKLLKIE